MVIQDSDHAEYLGSVTAGTICHITEPVLFSCVRSLRSPHLVDGYDFRGIARGLDFFSKCLSLRFAMPVHWVRESAHDGHFTVESDRARVAEVLHIAFESKLASLSKESHLFRYLLAGKSRLLGLRRSPAVSLESFVEHFGFESMEEAIAQKTGMVATACAVLTEDLVSLERLAEAKAELNPQLPGIMEVGLTRGWTPLHLALSHCSHGRGTRAAERLLSLRADPNSCNRGGMPALGFCTSVEAVNLMLESRAEVNFSRGPGGLTALALSTLLCAPAEVVQRLLQARADPNGRGCGIGHAALSTLAISADGNPHLLEHVKVLLQARADVNQGGQTGGIVWIYEILCRLKDTLGCTLESLGISLGINGAPSSLSGALTDRPLVERFTAEASSTALGVASLLSREKLVCLLLKANADPSLPNNRGHTPRDLTKRESILHLMQKSQALRTT